MARRDAKTSTDSNGFTTSPPVVERPAHVRTGPGPETAPDGSLNGVVVDIAIPTLGTSPYLVEAIESVFAQTHSEWRLVIGENGAGLKSVRNAVEPYAADPRVQHITTGKLIARPQNWTQLIRIGNAPYHALLHDDDYWDSGYLERRLSFLVRHPSCGFIFSNYTAVDREGRAIARSNLNLKEGVHPSSRILPFLYRRMVIGAPTAMVRRSAYEAVGSKFKDIFFTDNEMWIRLAAKFDVGYLAVADAYYRFHSLQDSSSRTELAKDLLAVLDAVDDLPIPRRLRNAVRAEAHTWVAFDAIERENRGEALEHLTRALRTARTSLVRPSLAGRLLVGFTALGLGERGRRAVVAVRDRRWRSRRRKGISYTADMVRVGKDLRGL